MQSSQSHFSSPSLPAPPQFKTLFHGGSRILEIRPLGFTGASLPMPFPTSNKGFITITMRDRSKNRKPLQRGRNLSIEAIQTVQALKRSNRSSRDSLELVFESKVRRLLKFDLIAVLRELQRQNEALLALQVFEDVRREHWYKPQVSVYADMIAVLATNGLFEKVELLFSCMKMEGLDADTEGFNRLLRTLMEFNITKTTMECFYLMEEVGCEPDEATFRILINGFESKGQVRLSAILRQDAEKYFGGSLEFLEDEETAVL